MSRLVRFITRSPSTESTTLALLLTSLLWTSRTLLGENRMVLEKREWGQMGVSSMVSMPMSIIGPPADMAYPVDPVGVEKMTPSAR